AYQLGYPPETEIDGCSVGTYVGVLRALIGLARRSWNEGEEVLFHSEDSLVSGMASGLGLEPETARRAISAFTFDRENAGYHAAVAGIAAAPLVRGDRGSIAFSRCGLTAQPLLFMTRELRRRAAENYHNVAHRREAMFRQDLYGLFGDRRFVASPGRIALRRENGNLRTDIDAAIFDRKTGTLGLFELKSQDPFARSMAELNRQRDSVLYANHQVSGVLDWINRHGAGEILERVDRQTAKRFRVQKVYPFVLGRYLVHFNDGPQPDRRAVWATWPAVLRMTSSSPFSGSETNPIASLFARLPQDVSIERPDPATPPRRISVGDLTLVVHGSRAEFEG
ncbi:MAG TPA: hypothetical protein VFQ54_11250, partial [Thermomicrobiales bacterium]|nr:hypothetical protein [Thermomicrobiales bacterium]